MRRHSLLVVLVASLLLCGFSFSAARTCAPQTDSTFAGPQRLLEQGKFAEAIAALEELRKSQPELQGLSRELGIAYYRKGDYLDAVTNLQRAIKENPNDSEAMPYLEKVQSWYPNANVDAAYILGVSYIQTKNYPHARVAFAKMFGVPAE